MSRPKSNYESSNSQINFKEFAKNALKVGALIIGVLFLVETI